MKDRLFFRSCLVATTLATTACAGERRAEAPTADMAMGGDSVTFTAAQIRHGGIAWDSARTTSVADVVTIPGEIAPDEDRTARLGAPARGRVLVVHVAPGDRVRAGAALVTLESPEASAARADVVRATAAAAAQRAQAAYVGAARGRADRLLALGALSRQDHERAVAEDEAARATQREADAELRRAQLTAHALGSDSATGGLVLRAPRDGVVLRRDAVPGAVVEAGTPLVTLTDPAHLWLTGSAPEGASGMLRRGVTVRFIVPALPADTFTARLDAVAPGLDPETRTLAVRASIASADGRLKPEMLATLFAIGATTRPALALPDDAVQRLGDRAVVFLATPDGKGSARFRAKTVTVAGRRDGLVTIVDGLAPGDIVVTKGAFAIKAHLETGTMPDMEM